MRSGLGAVVFAALSSYESTVIAKGVASALASCWA